MKKIDINNLPDWCAKWPFWDAITKCSARYSLDPYVVASFIQTESKGTPWAVRYERHFLWVYPRREIVEMAKEIRVSPNTMDMLQRTSWGLMQVMGSTFYDHGGMEEIESFKKTPLSMTVPEVGIKYGCKHLRSLYERFGPAVDDVVAAYNAGSPKKAQGSNEFVNQRYVDHFFNNLHDIYAKVRY